MTKRLLINVLLLLLFSKSQILAADSIQETMDTHSYLNINQNILLTIPRINVEKHCMNMVALSGLSGGGVGTDVLERCLQNEQIYYDYIKEIWSNLSDDIKVPCAKKTIYAENNNLSQGYAGLRGCINLRLYEEQTSRQFEEVIKKNKFNY